MGGERVRSFRDLPAGAAKVFRGFTVLDVTEASLDELAAVVDMSMSEVEISVGKLIHAGLFVATRPHWYATAGNHSVSLQEQSRERSAESDLELRRRFIDFALAAVSVADPAGGDGSPPTPEVVEWMRDHRANLLAAVRMGAEHDLAEPSARLALALWRLAPEVVDRTWWPDLTAWGEKAATTWRNPSVLMSLFEHSARMFRQASDLPTAEAQWVRALAIGQRLGDDARTDEHLRALSELYRVWGRLHRVLDIQFERLSLIQRSTDNRAIARVLAELGATMLAADRVDAAVEYLSRADQAFTALAEPDGRGHAQAMVLLGRAYWRRAAHAAARRFFSDALAILVDLDDIAAEHVRQLLKTSDREPLPEQAPLLDN